MTALLTFLVVVEAIGLAWLGLVIFGVSRLEKIRDREARERAYFSMVSMENNDRWPR